MLKPLSQLHEKLKALNSLCDIVDDELSTSDDPRVKAGKDLFDFIWSELQNTEKTLNSILEILEN